MCLQRLEKLQPPDVSWFRIGYDDMTKFRSFKPPREMDASSSYLAGWQAALSDMAERNKVR